MLCCESAIYFLPLKHFLVLSVARLRFSVYFLRDILFFTLMSITRVISV